MLSTPAGGARCRQRDPPGPPPLPQPAAHPLSVCAHMHPSAPHAGPPRPHVGDGGSGKGAEAGLARGVVASCRPLQSQHPLSHKVLQAGGAGRHQGRSGGGVEGGQARARRGTSKRAARRRASGVPTKSLARGTGCLQESSPWSLGRGPQTGLPGSARGLDWRAQAGPLPSCRQQRRRVPAAPPPPASAAAPAWPAASRVPASVAALPPRTACCWTAGRGRPRGGDAAAGRQPPRRAACRAAETRAHQRALQGCPPWLRFRRRREASCSGLNCRVRQPGGVRRRSTLLDGTRLSGRRRRGSGNTSVALLHVVGG